MHDDVFENNKMRYIATIKSGAIALLGIQENDNSFNITEDELILAAALSMEAHLPETMPVSGEWELPAEVCEKIDAAFIELQNTMGKNRRKDWVQAINRTKDEIENQ